MGLFGFLKGRRPNEAGRDDTFEQAAHRLMPVVVNLREMQVVAMENDGPESWPPHRPLADPLGVVVAIDRPHGFDVVGPTRLGAWDCSFDDVFDRAMANLVARSPNKFRKMREGFFVSDYGDPYAGSRLLMPELFRGSQLKGSPIAIAVSLSCLVVADSEDPAALHYMCDFVVRRFNAEPAPISWLPLILEGETWRAIDPYSRELDAIRDLAIRQALWDYVQQGRALEAYLAKRDEDVFVAPIELAKTQGDAHTWTSWTENVPALLPRAEALGLTSADGQVLFRLWRDVEALCGRFERDEAWHPARYRPPQWPTCEIWARLQADFQSPEWLPESVDTKTH